MWKTFTSSITGFVSGYSLWLIIIAATTGLVGYKAYQAGYEHAEIRYLKANAAAQEAAIEKALADYKASQVIADNVVETITVIEEKIKEVEVPVYVYKDRIKTEIKEICSNPSNASSFNGLLLEYNRAVEAANSDS